MTTKTPSTPFDLDKADADDIWRKELEVINRLETGQIHFAMAKEITNACGKALKVLQVKLEYSKLRREKPDIRMLNAK